MKKYVLFITCSFLAVGSANALTASEQLKALKDAYMKNFNEMDANKDGKITNDEIKELSDLTNKDIKEISENIEDLVDVIQNEEEK